MPTNTGDLNKRVDIYRPAPADKDRYGHYTPEPQLVATAWAAIRPVGATETLAAAQLQSGQTHVITVRYRPALAAIRGECWFQMGTRIFNIVGLPANIDEANTWLRFQAKEGTGHGH